VVRHDLLRPFVTQAVQGPEQAERGRSVWWVVQVTRLIIVPVAAAVVGVVVAVVGALIGNRVLTAIYGADLAPIDDTLPMILAVWTTYLVAVLSAIAVVIVGWRRFVRRR
jgi:hypothetical protein